MIELTGRQKPNLRLELIYRERLRRSKLNLKRLT